MDYFICYDIHSPKRLASIANVLRNYGFRIQRSFFTCDLSSDELKKVRDMLVEQIVPSEDRVAIYPICEKCRKKGIYFGCDANSFFSQPYKIL
jgi:CRISPR-associated protein Cas2